jgi:threonine dehydratase
MRSSRSRTDRTVTAQDVARARFAGADVVRRTPVLAAETLSERAGSPVVLKAESLQRTGAFKVRGALSKLAALGEACAPGVVCGSAGNHAQGLALAARARGVRCEVFMPAEAPIAKVEACLALGARVELGGASVEACVAAARERAASGGLAFVHPFDDPDVVAGQGTLGLELLEDLPDLATVVVPLGGGGLVSGVAIAVKAARPDVRVVGVRASPVDGLTIADGIAVKHPGDLTQRLVDRWVDEVVRVEDDDVAEAMVLLLEQAKLVVEGAGAAGVAALLSGAVAADPRGTTCVVLSGGNVDAGLLAVVARRHETGAGRRLVLLTRVADRPGRLARLLEVVGEEGANLVDVVHLREGLDLHVRETAVQLVLETRGREHAERVVRAVTAAGYRPQLMA